jgi:hypothetical protein
MELGPSALVLQLKQKLDNAATKVLKFEVEPAIRAHRYTVEHIVASLINMYFMENKNIVLFTSVWGDGHFADVIIDKLIGDSDIMNIIRRKDTEFHSKTAHFKIVHTDQQVRGLTADVCVLDSIDTIKYNEMIAPFMRSNCVIIAIDKLPVVFDKSAIIVKQV